MKFYYNLTWIKANWYPCNSTLNCVIIVKHSHVTDGEKTLFFVTITLLLLLASLFFCSLPPLLTTYYSYIFSRECK